VFYSFCAYDCVDSFIDKFPVVHAMNTTQSAGFDIFRGATHVMIFGVKA